MQLDNFRLALFFSFLIFADCEMQCNLSKNNLTLKCKKLNSRFGLVVCSIIWKNMAKNTRTSTKNIKINENNLLFSVRHFWFETTIICMVIMYWIFTKKARTLNRKKKKRKKNSIDIAIWSQSIIQNKLSPRCTTLIYNIKLLVICWAQASARSFICSFQNVNGEN